MTDIKQKTRANKRNFLIGALIAACLLALVVSPYASSWPDGLERVAEKLGFIENASVTAEMPIPDYSLPGVENDIVATGAAGIAGTLITFGLVFIIARIIAKKNGK